MQTLCRSSTCCARQVWRSIPSAGTALRPVVNGTSRWIRTKAPGPGRKTPASTEDAEEIEIPLEIDNIARNEEVLPSDAELSGSDREALEDASAEELEFATKVPSQRAAKRLLNQPFDDGLATATSASESESGSEVEESDDGEIEADTLESLEALDEANAYQEARASISAHLARLRRIDMIALEEERERSKATSTTADIDVATGAELDDNAGAVDVRSLPDPGPPVDYCIFCYHGTFGLLRPENGLLLSRFVSERGSILPKRFTKCCPKHQRKLSATIRRARNLNLLPFHSKLHPRLRFGSLLPAPPAYLAQHAGVQQAGSATAPAPRGLPVHADPVKVQQAVNRVAAE